METIKELRVICQTTAKKDVSNYYMRYVSRFFSIYLTRLLLPLPVSADQASFAMILTGVISCFLFLSAQPSMFLWGALGLQLWYILDCVDGEIARYRFYQKGREVVLDKMTLSMTGAYWDYLNHYIVHGLAPFAVSFGFFHLDGRSAWLLIGFAASFFQMLLLAVHDSKSRAYVAKIAKEAVGTCAVQARPSSSGSGAPAKHHSLPKLLFMAVHYSCTYPTVMNVITLTAALNMMTAGSSEDLRGNLILYYAVASGIVFAAIAAKNLFRKGIDREFERQFEIRITA